MAYAEPATSLIVMWAIIGACILAALVGMIVAITCWYKLRQDVKTQSEADYPAYASDMSSYSKSGDHKLAQSAQLYHYQRQKQKILELERAESERDADEKPISDDDDMGEFSVYECPGLAPTGELEVKNPLFDENHMSSSTSSFK